MIYDFEVRAGNTGTVKNEGGLEVVLKTGGATPASINLTGEEIVFVVRASARSSVLLRKTSADGGVIVAPVEGRITVPFTVEETRALWGASSGTEVTLQYELERRRSSPAMQRTALSGKVTVLPGVNDD
jgi:hypothetical protein